MAAFEQFGPISWTILAAGTLGLVVFSWVVSLKAKRYHGIFRFFAFESILVMVLINTRCWFHDPFSIRQIASWLFLLSSMVAAAHGFVLLNKVGKPEGQMEQTTRLIEVGAYRYIRHPLYLSLILGAVGVFLKNISWPVAALGLIAIASAYGTAKVEEGEMTARFGEEYKEYMQRSRMFVPFIF